jgi:hypothetical protein
MYRIIYIFGLIYFLCGMTLGEEVNNIKHIKQEIQLRYDKLKEWQDNYSIDMDRYKLQSVQTISNELKIFRIKDSNDLNDLVDINRKCLEIIQTLKNSSDLNYYYQSVYYSALTDCFTPFENVQEQDKFLESQLLLLMDDEQEELQLYSIKALGIIKSEKAAPELRKRIKRFNRLLFVTKSFFSPVIAYRKIEFMKIVSEALGCVAEDKDFHLFVDRFYDLEGATGKGLLKIGKKGFEALLDMAIKERQERKEGERLAGRALWEWGTSKEFVGEWIKIFNNGYQNDYFQKDAIHGIFENRNVSIEASNFIEQMKKNYLDKNVNGDILACALKEEKDIPVLVHILENEKDIYLLESCIGNVSFIGRFFDNPSALVAAIEKIIYNHGNKEVRNSAENALLCIGEKESLIRLEKHLISNNRSKGYIERIQKRIKSGRKGPHYFDDFSEDYYNYETSGWKK